MRYRDKPHIKPLPDCGGYIVEYKCSGAKYDGTLRELQWAWLRVIGWLRHVSETIAG